MARKKNARVAAVKQLRNLKKLTDYAVYLLTEATTKDIYIPYEDREPSMRDVVYRPRTAAEHTDNLPGKFVEARKTLQAIASDLQDADRLLRLKMAEFGLDARGVHVGIHEAVRRLSDRDQEWLSRYGFADRRQLEGMMIAEEAKRANDVAWLRSARTPR